MHSRLIQNALEEAVFNKMKKAKLAEDSSKGESCKNFSRNQIQTDRFKEDYAHNAFNKKGTENINRVSFNLSLL